VSAAAHSGFSSVQQLGFDKAQQAHLNSQIANIALDVRKKPSNYIDDGHCTSGDGAFSRSILMAAGMTTKQLSATGAICDPHYGCVSGGAASTARGLHAPKPSPRT
jgi:hypothetical protein